MPYSVITLLTDFGLTDPYAGVIKGVILTTAPDARIVDLTHEVPPQAVLQGAFLLETAWRYFPAGSVHLAVVDPGVGTSRRRIALRAGWHTFVGPDNGLLSCALPDDARGPRMAGDAYAPRTIPLPPDIEAVEIDVQRLGAPPSATFEGRDVFAPSVARLAAGAALRDLGPPLREVEAYPAFRAPARDGVIEGLVLHVDAYGNLVTDIRAIDLPANATVHVAGRELRLSHTYATSSGLCAIVGSAGFVEIALPNASASRELGLGTGAKVKVDST